MKLLCLALLPLALLSTCSDKPKAPAVAPTVVGGGAAAHTLNASAEKLPEKQAEADAAQKKQLSKIGAEIKVGLFATNAITAPEDERPKKTLEAALKQAEIELGGAPIDPADAEMAMARALLNMQGRFQEAEARYATAQTEATKAKIERDAAIAARDAQLAELPKLVEAHRQELEANRANAQKIADALTKQINSERREAADKLAQVKDEERKRMLGYLSWALLGLAIGGAILAIATMYLSKGLEWQRAAIASGGSVACFALYWTLNQPWFKYCVWAVLVLGVIAAIWWIYTEHATTKAKVLLKSAADEVAEKEALLRATATKIVARVDTLKTNLTAAVEDLNAKKQVEEALTKTFTALRGDMNDEEKNVVHELRFIKATTAAKA